MEELERARDEANVELRRLNGMATLSMEEKARVKELRGE